MNTKPRESDIDCPVDNKAGNGGHRANPASIRAEQLGIRFVEATSMVLKRLEWPRSDVTGALITQVEVGSAAAERGVSDGMVITHINGTAIPDVEGALRTMSAVTVAGSAQLRLVDRDGHCRVVNLDVRVTDGRSNAVWELLRSVPQWFLTMIALVYASGFLVVMTSLDRFGVKEASTQFWKGRYIHIGALCIALPLLVNGVVYPLCYVYKSRGDWHQRRSTWQLIPSLLLALNLVCAFYIFLLTTRPSTVDRHLLGHIPVVCIVGVSVIGMLCISSLERACARRWSLAEEDRVWHGSPYRPWSACARWALLAVVLYFTVGFYMEFGSVFDRMPVPQRWHTAGYVGLVVLLGALPWRIHSASSRIPLFRQQRALWLTCVCIVLQVYYMSVIAFAWTLFPYIPANRGGGDYTTVSPVVLKVKDALHSKYMAPSPKGEFTTVPLIAIEETAAGLYLARRDDGGGPRAWRYDGRDKRPEIIYVPRESILTILTDLNLPAEP